MQLIRRSLGRRLRGGLCGLVLLAVTACGGSKTKPTYAVKGKVLVNGQPAANAMVVLMPQQADDDTPRPRGLTDAQGQFQLSTYKQNDGAPVGKYDVTVEWFNAAQDPRELGPDALKGKYAKAETSGLKAEVKAQSQELPPLELTSSETVSR
jgi:hypothetical protein